MKLIIDLLIVLVAICSTNAVNTVFEEAHVKGEEYVRVGKAQSYTYDHHRKLFGPMALYPNATCSTDQVHITIGDDEGSIVVSYTDYKYSESGTVYYSLSKSDIDVATFNPASATLMSASGIPSHYSEVEYITKSTFSPAMGKPLVSVSTYLQRRNTSWFAFDPTVAGAGAATTATGHYSNYQYIQPYLSNPIPTASGSTTIGSGNPLGFYANPNEIYDSPLLYTIELPLLKPNTKYYYRPSGACTTFSFTTTFLYADAQLSNAAAAYPFTMGLLADVGVTDVSAASIAAIGAMQPNVALLVGDLCYADGNPDIWDIFGRMITPVFSSIPLLTAGGNHEISSGENWVNYQQRYFTAHERSHSPSHEYWAREVGPSTIISLSSYHAAYPNSIQYQWLKSYLSNHLNRVRTPWLIVMFHAPWYSTNLGHWRESEMMRQSVEPLLYQYGVDLVLTGHIHAYERTAPMYNYKINSCGAVHMVIGDAGNYEGAYTPWPHYIPTGPTNTTWSIFRESSFGVAKLKLIDANSATVTWNRVACENGGPVNAANNWGMNINNATCFTTAVYGADNSPNKFATSDSFQLTRPPAALCPNKYTGAGSMDYSFPSQSPTTRPSSSPTAPTVRAYLGLYVSPDDEQARQQGPELPAVR